MPKLAHDSRSSALLCSAILSLATILGSCGSNEPKPSATDAMSDGFVELRMEARKTITDSVRRDKYITATQALEDALRGFDETASSLVQDYRKAFADYGTDKATLNDIAAKFRAEQSKASAQFVQAHTAMAASVTADEWKPLAKKENKLLESIKAAAARSLE
jgi:predicted transcriptional regulator of viral defense system